jgi:hypothetical protein
VKRKPDEVTPSRIWTDRDPNYAELESFANSRWFKRGWTLQELIAPEDLNFYFEDWQTIGSRSAMGPIIQKITGIPKSVFSNSSIFSLSVAQRMSWAAQRETTRAEDIAYCLMGLFNCNLPMLYGK